MKRKRIKKSYLEAKPFVKWGTQRKCYEREWVSEGVSVCVCVCVCVRERERDEKWGREKKGVLEIGCWWVDWVCKIELLAYSIRYSGLTFNTTRQ
jgi:hypothetical protein